MEMSISLIILFSLFLFSCGGNENSVPTTGNNNNNAPTAMAGFDQYQPRDTVVLLDGRNSEDPDSDLLSYEWSLKSVPVGSSAVLSDPTSPTPTFIPDLLGEYIVNLVVNDGSLTSEADEILVVVNTVRIYENDFTSNSLDGFLIGDNGSARVLIDEGKLRIDPGEGHSNSGYVSLDLTVQSSEYTSKLIDSPSKIYWAFNISNVDGSVCGGCNNLFLFELFSHDSPNAASGFGYILQGGGFVGSRFLFSQEALAFSPYGPISNTILDISDGLETLPTIGAFKISYDPTTSLWELFYEESTVQLNPKTINTKIGSRVNTGFVTEDLPYLILGSENTSTAFFDNLAVWVEFEI
jgi:hypothetical protein